MDEGQELLHLLQDLAADYREYLDLGREKERRLRTEAPPDLRSLLSVEQDLMARVGRLEGRRLLLLQQILPRLGLAADAALPQVADRIGGSLGEALWQQGQALLGLVEEIDALNRCLDPALRSWIDFIQRTMDLLRIGDTPLYDREGQASDGVVSRALFDRRI